MLNVQDVTESCRFYQEILGFNVAFTTGPYAGVSLGDAMLHLNAHDDEWGKYPGTVRITVPDIDAWYRKMENKSLVKTDEKLFRTPWGYRQFSVLDPDRNRITFVQFDGQQGD